MGYLDLWGRAIADAADAAGIKWCIVSGDGVVRYRVRLVNSFGVPADEDMTPGRFAEIVGAPSVEEFYGTPGRAA